MLDALRRTSRQARWDSSICSSTSSTATARLAGVVLLLALGVGCTGNEESESDPFAELPLETELSAAGLEGDVALVRDRHGVWHVYGDTAADVAFGNGYLHARDRFWQLDFFRRAASGTLSEVFGTVRPNLFRHDVQMRVHGMRRFAEEAYRELTESSDPGDRELALLLQRYADGVNLYRSRVERGHRADLAVYDGLLPPALFAPWTPVDSLAIARFQAWSLSFSSSDIDLSRVLEQARTHDQVPLFTDLYRIVPMDATATLPGFTPPGAEPSAERQATTPPRSANRGVNTERARQRVALLERASPAVAPVDIAPGLSSRHPRDGSNNWVVSGAVAGDAILANDPHLQLSSPSLLYFVHLRERDGVDIAGAGFPGVPGVVLGHNRHLAWGGTVVGHDVTDYYEETIAPCPEGTGDCVTFHGEPVPLMLRTESIAVGILGTITETVEVTIEEVPHHGPILPQFEDNRVVPRSADQALSVKWTGHRATHEARALLDLWRADDVATGMAAFERFGIGAQNWVLADTDGNIGWTTHALVPWRSSGCFTFHPETGPNGTAPHLVVPGDGSCEWEQFMAPGTLPHAANPRAGFLATANADPIGLTHDGDVTNGPRVDGRTYYLDATYAPGLRVGRIHRQLEELAAAGSVDLGAMARLQGDHRANAAALFLPHLLAAGAALKAELASPGSHLELAQFARTLPAPRRQALEGAIDRLGAWTLASPPAVGAIQQRQQVVDSTATTIFHAWMVELLPALFADDLDFFGASGLLPTTWLTPAALTALSSPEALNAGTSADTGQSLLCDDRGTNETESCRLVVLRALDHALTRLMTSSPYAGEEMDDWRWGRVHTLTLAALVPLPALNIPPPSDPNPALRGGYARHGTTFSVDVAPSEYDDYDFRFAHGPSMRHLVQLGRDRPTTWLSLPGGQSANVRSSHFRDLMDLFWSQNLYFTMAWSTEEIAASGEGVVRLAPDP